MASPPVPHNWSLLEQATSANLQSLTNAIDFLQKPPRCRVRKSANQSISNAVAVPITWDLEDYDPNGFHSTTSNNTRITPNISGLYLVTVGIRWDVDPDGQREIRINKNGSIVGRSMIPAISNQDTVQQAMAYVEFNGTTDFVEVAVQHTAGASINVQPDSPDTWFAVQWVAVDATTAF